MLVMKIKLIKKYCIFKRLIKFNLLKMKCNNFLLKRIGVIMIMINCLFIGVVENCKVVLFLLK